MDMDSVSVAITGINTVAVVGLVYGAGKYARRLEEQGERIAALEAMKTDVALASLGANVGAMSANLCEVRLQLGKLTDYLMARGGHAVREALHTGD